MNGDRNGGANSAENRATPLRSDPLGGLGSVQRIELARAKRAARWVGLILPLVLLTVGLALAIVWMPRMPDPAATHWGGGGGPDGFGSPWTYVWLLIGVGYGIVLLMWAMVAFSARMKAGGEPLPLWSSFQRFLAAFGGGFALFALATNLGSMLAQLDLANAAEAPGIGGIMAVAFALWALGTALGWFAQPRLEIRRASSGGAAPLPLADSERAVWFGEVRPSRAFLWIIGVALLVLVGSTVWVFWVPVPAGEQTAAAATRALMVFSVLLVVLLAATSSWFRVRIDERGLEARSALGLPVFRLPAAEVRSVEAARIEPLTEFGGWGLRWWPGRFGIVMRAGEAVVATRIDGRVFAITVDDADTAAALLAAVAAVAREPGLEGAAPRSEASTWSGPRTEGER